MAKPKIFLSYARKDKKKVLKLKRNLEKWGAKIWMDNSIDAGMTWDNTLEAEIRGCDILLIVWSNNSVKSENVQHEISFAEDLNKTVIPVLLEACEIPFRYRRIQHVDYTRQNSTQLQTVRSALGLKKPKRILRKLAVAAVFIALLIGLDGYLTDFENTRKGYTMISASMGRMANDNEGILSSAQDLKDQLVDRNEGMQADGQTAVEKAPATGNLANKTDTVQAFRSEVEKATPSKTMTVKEGMEGFQIKEHVQESQTWSPETSAEVNTEKPLKSNASATKSPRIERSAAMPTQRPTTGWIYFGAKDQAGFVEPSGKFEFQLLGTNATARNNDLPLKGDSIRYLGEGWNMYRYNHIPRENQDAVNALKKNDLALVIGTQTLNGGHHYLQIELK